MPDSSTRSSRTRSSVRLRPLCAADRAPIEALLAATGSFRADEIVVALELVDEGEAAGYRFLVAECEGRVAGYCCFGETPLTLGTWDLYWIAVDPRLQGSGIGRELMRAAEERVAREGARLLVVETSDKPSYAPTRAFYERLGYAREAELAHYYAPDDGKVVYVRRFA